MADDSDDDGALHQIQSEEARFFDASQWTGPFGISAAVGFWAILTNTTGVNPQHQNVWLGAMCATIALLFAAFLVPPLRRQRFDDGVPVASYVAHILIGTGFGLALWIDLDATRVAEFRWLTLSLLFALSAGVIGYSGPNDIGRVVAVPVWFGATTALAAAGELTAALGCAIFASITLKDMTRNRSHWRDLIELRKQSQEAAQANLKAATHDSLTGLLNRAGVMALLAERAADPTHPTSVMFIDLDHFKEVNDRFGHAAGDAVLVETTSRLEASLRGTDVVGRMGGDEFCVVLGSAHDETAPSRLAYRIIEELERPIANGQADDVYISASIGIATLHPGEATPERLLVHADHAMYRAKRTGRRRVVRFDQELRSEIDERSGLETSLRQAIRENALSADAQPIFNIRTGKIKGVELLARWRLPDGTAVPPNVFIPLAEDIGLISDLTRSMLHTAGTMLQQWKHDPLLGGASVGVNVSAIEFARGRLIQDIGEAIADFNITKGQLVLELTESQQLNDEAVDTTQFSVLEAMGASFAIDDFGSGYSSLDHLLSLPIDVVKLDLHLIDKLGVDPRQTDIVRGIHELAGVIGQGVVVEGVETQTQLDELLAIGAHLAQGYYLCRPVPVDELAEHVAAIEQRIAVTSG